MVRQLEKAGITEYEFITAHDRETMDQHPLWGKFIGSTLNLAEISLFLKHLEVFDRKNDDFVVVLEDDACFVEGFLEKIYQYMDAVKDMSWDILFTGECGYIHETVPPDASLPYFAPTKRSRGGCMYILNKHMSERLSTIAHEKEIIIHKPIDHWFNHLAAKYNFNYLMSEPTLVSQGSEHKLFPSSLVLKNQLRYHSRNGPKMYFTTFGGPQPGYLRRVRELAEQAGKSGVFEDVFAFTHADLYNDEDFRNHHLAFCMQNRRGFGYYIWKPWVILKTMEKLEWGSLLLYCDAGCELNMSTNASRRRFAQYFEMAFASKMGMLNFQMEHRELVWTKRAVFEQLNCSEQVQNSGQLVGGIICMRKTPECMRILNHWWQICSRHELLTNIRSRFREHPEFKEHRHDQSILSCLCKTYGTHIIPDETYFDPDWEKDGADFPIWAKRNRG